MMKKTLAFLVIFSIMLLGLSFADEMAKNYSVKGGILWQSGGTAENRADLTVGAEYELPSVDTQGKFTITADYISIKISDGSSDWALPVCVNYKWYGLATNNSYAGLGLGYFAAGGRALAYHAFAGLPMGSENFFLEGRYIGRGTLGNESTSFIGAVIGYKFK